MSGKWFPDIFNKTLYPWSNFVIVHYRTNVRALIKSLARVLLASPSVVPVGVGFPASHVMMDPKYIVGRPLGRAVHITYELMNCILFLSDRICYVQD
jgi:hypothetical protein